MKKILLASTLFGVLYGGDSFLFNVENDCIKSDDGYLSNSMVFSWVHDSKGSFYDNIGIQLHHNTYTPSNISEKNKANFDAPYAGHMFLDLSFYKTFKENYLHGFGISLGRIGDETYAKELQKGFHDLLSANNPQGWDHQIEDKTTVGVNYDFVQNIPLDKVFGENIDLNNHIHINYGNFSRGASFGSLIRYGNVLRDSFNTVGNRTLSLVRYPQTKGWSVSAGFTYDYRDYFYILDNFKEEYNLNDRDKDTFSTNLIFDYYTGESVFSLYLKNSDFGSNDKYWSKQWLGLSYSCQF